MTIGGTLKLEEGTKHGTVVGFKASDSEIVDDVVWALPSVDGSSGQCLVTDGNKTLSWASFVTKSYVDDLVKLVTINAYTSTDYTLQTSDIGSFITLDNASPITVTIPNSSSIPVGSRFDLFQKGVGSVTFVEGSGVTIRSKGNNKKINGQYVTVTIIKAEETIWYLIGDLTT